MSEQMQDVQENEETKVARVFDIAHKTFLAGLGAAGMAQDGLKKGFEGGNEFAGKLVERGETISNDRREQVTGEAEKRQEQAKDLGLNMTGAVGDTYNQYSTATLNRMNVPSRSDIQDLSKQIAALNRKVDKVRKEQQEKVAV